MGRFIYSNNKNVITLYLNMFFFLVSTTHVISQTFIAPEYILEFKVLPNYLEVFAFKNNNGVPGTYYVVQDVTTTATSWKSLSCYTIKNLDSNKTHKFSANKIQYFSTDKIYTFTKMSMVPIIKIGASFQNRLSTELVSDTKTYFSIGAANILPFETNKGINTVEVSELALTFIRRDNITIQNKLDGLVQQCPSRLNNGENQIIITGSGSFQSNNNVSSMYHNNIAISRAVLGLEYFIAQLNASLPTQDRFEVSPELNQGKVQYDNNNEIKLIGKDKDKFKCYFRESSGNGSVLINDYRNAIWIADVKDII